MEAFELRCGGLLDERTTLLDVAEAARATPAPSEDSSAASLMLTGYTERLTNGYPAAVEWWRRAVAGRMLRVSLAAVAGGCVETRRASSWTFESHATTARQRVRLVRDDGALTSLPVALEAAWRGRICSAPIGAADALVDEAHAIAAAIGHLTCREPRDPAETEVLARLGTRAKRRSTLSPRTRLAADKGSRSRSPSSAWRSRARHARTRTHGSRR